MMLLKLLLLLLLTVNSALSVVCPTYRGFSRVGSRQGQG